MHFTYILSPNPFNNLPTLILSVNSSEYFVYWEYVSEQKRQNLCPFEVYIFMNQMRLSSVFHR